jgi:hypothetical protein
MDCVYGVMAHDFQSAGQEGGNESLVYRSRGAITD